MRDRRRDDLDRLRQSRFDKQFDRDFARLESSFDKNFDKNFKRGFGVAIALWVIGALLSLGLTGVIIWGIIMFVLHFTG